MKKILIFAVLLLLILTGCNNIKNPPVNESKKYKVDLVYDDIIQQSTYIVENTTFSRPEDPIKDGYIFDGWYLEYDCENTYNFTMPVTNNITLYGRFIRLCEVVFYGTEIPSQKITNGNTIIKPNDPVKENYEFDGWYKDEQLTIPFDFSTKIFENITLYPKWINTSKYEVSFVIDSTIITQLVAHNNLALKPNDPEKDGHIFTGWYLNLEDELLFDFNTHITQNITLFAGFIKYYTISFDSNVENIIVLENEEFTLPIPSKDGYIFKGWYNEGVEFKENVKIDRDYNLTAKWEQINISNEDINIVSFSGYNEGIYIEFEKVNGYSQKSSYFVYYKKTKTSDYIEVDKQLIQENNSTIRCDILGLANGIYDIKIIVDSLEKNIPNVVVKSYDRSGYAHFNTTKGIGGYNNDGTVKDGAIIVYVTEETKNTVSAIIAGKTYIGIAEILKNKYKSEVPLIVRIIGKITAATWNEIEYYGDPMAKGGILDKNGNKVTSSLNETEIISLGINTLNITKEITKLNGLTNKIKYSSSEYDSYYNMLDISNANNITIEGVGVGATIFQWGFTWKNCNYIEIRNLTFDDYTEDACSFEGSDSNASSFKDFKTGHIWIHNNTFNEGINYWDVTREQDKHEGDGATDIKGIIYVTISYNHYYKNHKTGLVGGSDSVTTACVTFHHNFYDQCSSRLPLGRQANMHMYNNYYYKSSGTNMSIRAGGYALIENCVFENCKNPMQTADGAGRKGVIKSFNNLIVNCSGANMAVVVNNRDSFVDNDNIFNKTFDTDTTWFYYDSINKKSDVTIMNDTNDVAQYCMENAGVLKGEFVSEKPSYPPSDNKENIEIITLENLNIGSVESVISSDKISIYPKNGKTCNIKSCDIFINQININKYVEFGGGGSFNELCIRFNLDSKANITVYFSSGGSTARYIKLISKSESYVSSTSTIIGNVNEIVNHTFKNIPSGEYSICSSSSGINIYMIVIEYLN